MPSFYFEEDIEHHEANEPIEVKEINIFGQNYIFIFIFDGWNKHGNYSHPIVWKQKSH